MLCSKQKRDGPQQARFESEIGLKVFEKSLLRLRHHVHEASIAYQLFQVLEIPDKVFGRNFVQKSGKKVILRCLFLSDSLVN